MDQCFSDLPKSIQEQVLELITKEQHNATKLQVLDELQEKAMEIPEEQHCRLEEAKLNLMTRLTSKAETCEAENYGGTRSKTTSRAKTTAYAPITLP